MTIKAHASVLRRDRKAGSRAQRSEISAAGCANSMPVSPAEADSRGRRGRKRHPAFPWRAHSRAEFSDILQHHVCHGDQPGQRKRQALVTQRTASDGDQQRVTAAEQRDQAGSQYESGDGEQYQDDRGNLNAEPEGFDDPLV